VNVITLCLPTSLSCWTKLREIWNPQTW